MVEFQTKLYFNKWSLVMKYIESSRNLEVWNYDFLAKMFFSRIVTTYGSTQTSEDLGNP